MIAVPLLQPEQPITSFPHDFLLVWDWVQGKLQDREEYEALVNSRVPERSKEQSESREKSSKFLIQDLFKQQQELPRHY